MYFILNLKLINQIHCRYLFNLLIFNINFICENIGETWYLAADMQFYILSPLILVPLSLSKRKYKMIGIGIALFFIATNIIAAAITTNIEYPLFGFRTGYVSNAYFLGWCRIGAFTIGLLLGYKIYQAKQNEFLIKKKLARQVKYIYTLLIY